MRGTITKRPISGGKKFSWGFVFDLGRDEGGKRRQITKSGYRTKGEAEDALDTAIREARDGKLRPIDELLEPAIAHQAPRLAEFFETWFSTRPARKCAPKTLERYREISQYFLARIGTLRLDEIKPFTLEALLNELLDHGGRKDKKHPEGRPLAPKTVREAGFLLRACLEAAVEWDHISKNPLKASVIPKRQKTDPPMPDRDGLQAMMDQARGTRLFPLIALAAATGCRRGELLALQWTDIDFEKAIMSVSKSLEQTKAGLRVKSTKSEKPREIVLPQAALDVLKKHRAVQEQDREMFRDTYMDNGLVFCRVDGFYHTPDNITDKVTDLARKVGLENVTLHGLRHSHASELISAGTPPTTIAERLGHANANITLSIYSHPLKPDAVAAAKAWNDKLSDVITANRTAEPKRMLANVRRPPNLSLKPVDGIEVGLVSRAGLEPATL